MPALLISTSSTPNSASTHSAARATDRSSVTSSWTNRASPPAAMRSGAAPSSAAAPRPRLSSRAPTRTVRPSAPSCRAVAYPMPLLAPVISAIVVMRPSLPAGRRDRERPAEPGTTSTSLRPGQVCEPGVTIGEMNRDDLATFLRTRRDRLRPADVGLPDGGRRRAKGLPRQEVAQLAGMSVGYYIRLEQARGPHPSAQILAALSRALMLTADEREYLFQLAGESPPAAVRPT